MSMNREGLSTKVADNSRAAIRSDRPAGDVAIEVGVGGARDLAQAAFAELDCYEVMRD